MNPAKLLILTTLLITSVFSHALELDREQPISIEADKAERDEKNGVTIYQGKVILIQGSLRMDAEKVVFFDAEGDLNKIEATGEPAKFVQKPAEDQEPVHATGNTIRYLPQEDLLQLLGNASLTQEGSLFSGDTIDYDIANRVIKGNSSNTQSSSTETEQQAPDNRVKVIYTPKASNKTANPQTSETDRSPAQSSKNQGSTN